MKYRCKNCGYIYSYPLDEITNCLMCNGNKTDIVEWDIDEGFIKKEKDKKRVWVNDLNPSIARIDELCIDCGMCQKTCTEMTNISYDKQISDNPICIHCGQCVINCPTKALVPKYDYKKVLDYLNDTNYIVTISVAPAVRVSIGDLFNYPPGEYLDKKLASALRRLKFDKVFDLTFGADVTIMEEATELVSRIKAQKNLPQFTSCCPSWVKYCEMFHDDLLNHLSTTKSPIMIQGSLIKTYYSEFNNIDPNKIINVMVAPCVAKKYEARRHEHNDIDYVITVQELVMMLKECNIDFNSLPDEDFDPLFSIGSGAGIIFGRTGGVMEAALRTAYYLITNEKAPDQLYNLSNLEEKEGIKEGNIQMGPYNVRFAIVNGMSNLEKILKIKEQYDFIEVMNCPGGCIGGGGQPLLAIPQTKIYNEKRIESLIKKDHDINLRDSYENPEVKELYDTYLDFPMSNRAEKLLHTKYFSKRHHLPNKKDTI